MTTYENDFLLISNQYRASSLLEVTAEKKEKLWRIPTLLFGKQTGVPFLYFWTSHILSGRAQCIKTWSAQILWSRERSYCRFDERTQQTHFASEQNQRCLKFTQIYGVYEASCLYGKCNIKKNTLKSIIVTNHNSDRNCDLRNFQNYEPPDSSIHTS